MTATAPSAPPVTAITFLEILAWRRLLGHLPNQFGWKGYSTNQGQTLVVERWVPVYGAADRSCLDSTITFDLPTGTTTIDRDGFAVTMKITAVRSHRNAVIRQLRAFGFKIEGKAY